MGVDQPHEVWPFYAALWLAFTFLLTTLTISYAFLGISFF
jgi:hypothetical protein